MITEVLPLPPIATETAPVSEVCREEAILSLETRLAQLRTELFGLHIFIQALRAKALADEIRQLQILVNYERTESTLVH